MPRQNFLLGRGERLTSDVVVKNMGGPKEAPYTFDEAKSRLIPMLDKVIKDLDSLPRDAFPENNTVFSLILNPEYIAKSYFPECLFQKVGIEIVGSRPTKIKPQKKSKSREPVESITTQLFAKANYNSLKKWRDHLPNWQATDPAARDFISIEAISTTKPKEKIKGTIPKSGAFLLEIVLHCDEIQSKTGAIKDFEIYLQKRNIHPDFEKKFFAQGLCFLELEATADLVTEIASYSIVRALRQMPNLRILRPTIRTKGMPSSIPNLPTDQPISQTVSLAIFDGGIPADHPLSQWVNPIETKNLGKPSEQLLDHGVAVTSAALFGHINPREPLPRPYTYIDHYRVLDNNPSQDPHQLFETLDRIMSVLGHKEYDFINLSIGPHLPIEDDEIHVWTAVLDHYLARCSTLATVAVGNDGESDDLTGLNRIQVPSDCVNAIGVGACDSPDKDWFRAGYSSIGPGRSPGHMKPDIVSFGGSIARPFTVLSKNQPLRLTTTGGTSFAAPSVTRIACGVKAQFGSNLNNLAIRALLIHTAENGSQNRAEIGWGRCVQKSEDLVLCADDEIRVVYQGEISPAKYIRALIPMPTGEITGNINLKATLCFKTKTDPHHPGNYTQAGIEVTFRPHDRKFKNEHQLHPDSKSFFGSSAKGKTETELRRDAMKWENCIHASKTMRATSLNNPKFDIHYNSRLESHNFRPDETLSYALIVSVKAKGRKDFYDQVVRKYSKILEQIKPTLEIQIDS